MNSPIELFDIERFYFNRFGKFLGFLINSSNNPHREGMP